MRPWLPKMDTFSRFLNDIKELTLKNTPFSGVNRSKPLMHKEKDSMQKENFALYSAHLDDTTTVRPGQHLFP